MLLDLCSRLGVDLLVEGVETYDELDLFARMGVPLAQGFVFGRPEMTPRRLIDDDLAVRLKFRAGLRRHQDKIAGHVDVSTVGVRVADAAAEGARADLGAVVGAASPAVVVDGAGRPVGVVTRDAAGREVHHPVLSVTAAEAVASAAQRAMTRTQPDRFAPLVCVDSAGRHVGVVTIEALVLALAERRATDGVAEVRLP
jgi:CBS domain-containing protein